MQSVDNIKNDSHVRLTVLVFEPVSFNDAFLWRVYVFGMTGRLLVWEARGSDRGLILGNLISGIFPQNFDKNREEAKCINVLSLQAKI